MAKQITTKGAPKPGGRPSQVGQAGTPKPGGRPVKSISK